MAPSESTLTSQPLAGLPSQSAKPAAQAPIAQAPIAQVGVALAKAQRMPQPPQLAMSAARTATSQPLAGMPSQSAKPGAQLPTTQALLTQAWTLTLGSRHSVAQSPQWVGSFVVETQAPEQLVSPVPQEAPQTPAEQTWPAAQAWPQLPQLARSAWRS